MKFQPLISVVIPCYNCQAYIEQTLASVFEQTYSNYEVIVVNDGSTDHTLEILNRYALQLTILNIENSGVSKARNTGVKKATGKYIAFCDSDDIWHPKKLESHMNLGAHAFSFTAIELIGGGMEENFEYVPPTKNNINGIRGLLTDNYVATSSVLVKKEIFEQLKGFDVRFSRLEDWHLWLRIKSRYDFEFINRPLCRYRVHSQGASKDFERCARSGKKVLSDVFEKHIPDLKAEQTKFIGICYLTYATQAYYSKNYKDARSLYCLAAIYLKKVNPSFLKNWLISCLPPVLIEKLKAHQNRFRRI